MACVVEGADGHSFAFYYEDKENSVLTNLMACADLLRTVVAGLRVLKPVEELSDPDLFQRASHGFLWVIIFF